MTARAYSRGWPIEYAGGWVYSDTKEPVGERPCKRCGCNPTPEGHDACLGTISYCKSACCGHGVEEPYAIEAYRELVYIEGGPTWGSGCSGCADFVLVRSVDHLDMYPGNMAGCHRYVRTTRTWVSPLYGTIHTIFTHIGPAA